MKIDELTIPILIRCHPCVFLEILEKERRIWKIQFVGDFLDTAVAVLQQLLGLQDNVLVNPIRCRLTAGFLHDFGEVLWRDAKLVSIKPYVSFPDVVPRDQVQESFKNDFVSG